MRIVCIPIWIPLSAVPDLQKTSLYTSTISNQKSLVYHLALSISFTPDRVWTGRMIMAAKNLESQSVHLKDQHRCAPRLVCSLMDEVEGKTTLKVTSRCGGSRRGRVMLFHQPLPSRPDWNMYPSACPSIRPYHRSNFAITCHKS